MDPKEVTKLIKPIALSNKNFSKIFCIGANKTGTTSLAATLEIIGYKLPNQMDQEMHLSKQTYLGNYEPLREYVNKYDVFQDIPFSIGNFYIVADALFPNSLFINNYFMAKYMDFYFNFSLIIFTPNIICFNKKFEF